MKVGRGRKGGVKGLVLVEGEGGETDAWLQKTGSAVSGEQISP